MGKLKEMDVVFLLDKSGSMAGSEKDTIGGYNSYLEKQKKNKVNTKITTVLFDHEYEKIYDRIPLKDVPKLTEDDYSVRGSTALFDAIGETINDLEKKTKNKVLFIITTDGFENASIKYTKDQIKEMIEGHKDWEFLYIGANIDVYAEGSKIGISRENAVKFSKTKEGIDAMFCKVAKFEKRMYDRD